MWPSWAVRPNEPSGFRRRKAILNHASALVSNNTQGSRRDQKIKRSRGGRWSWTFKLAQKRSWVGRWSWVAKVGLLSLRVVRQQQFNGHCLWDSAQARRLKQQLRSALVAGQWRGDTALTLPLFWRRSTVSPVFFGRYPRSSLHSLVLFLLPFPSLISHLASVGVKQNVLEDEIGMPYGLTLTLRMIMLLLHAEVSQKSACVTNTKCKRTLLFIINE